MNPRVCIIQSVMKDYRLPSFVRLAERLLQAGTTLGCRA